MAACLTWLALGVLPSVARAGCGHGVASATDPLQALARLEILHEATGDASPIAPSERPRPCTGALCSGRPALPLVPATSTVTVAEHWGCLAAISALAEVDRRAERPAEPSVRPVHRGPSIDRPPRPA